MQENARPDGPSSEVSVSALEVFGSQSLPAICFGSSNCLRQFIAEVLVQRCEEIAGSPHTF